MVKDLAALSFVREDLVALIAQDTHLRGTPHFMNFVDMALYAVFGTELNHASIGAAYYGEQRNDSAQPLSGQLLHAGVGGVVLLPMAANSFPLSAPAARRRAFLPPARGELDVAA